MTPPWRKNKPVFRLYHTNNGYIIKAVNGIACGFKYKEMINQLGYCFNGYEDPTIKVKYER